MHALCRTILAGDLTVLPVGLPTCPLIVDGERPIGFLMAFLDIDFAGDGKGANTRSRLWRLNIAAGEQGPGYGHFAVESVAA